MFEKILFCTDFSENSDHAFSYAFNLATALSCNAFLFRYPNTHPLHSIVEGRT